MYNTPKDEDGGIEYLMKPQPGMMNTCASNLISSDHLLDILDLTRRVLLAKR